jgi:gliding motility-associated-like protein
MKKILSISAFIFVCLLFSNQNLFSQSVQQSTRLKYLSYVFPNDSLKGFDEVSMSNDALQRGFFGIEYKVFMYRAKREFINKKYGYSSPSSANFLAKGTHPVINNAPCVNEDFEASASSTSTVVGVGSVGTTLAGWTVTEGSNSNSCTLGGCCPTAGGNDAWVRSTPWNTGSVIGTIPNSPLGGTKVLQMNDVPVNVGEEVMISQTFPVTSTNALFQIAYMAEMDGSGHVCCDQPFMTIKMKNCSNVVLACPSVSITPPGASCASTMPSGWATNSSGISYTTAWQVYSLDLTPYLSSCVTIEIIVGDCDGWAHHGMAFIDCACKPMTINVNNIPFPVGTNPIVNVSVCSGGTGTITAPPGLGPYTWNGPPGSGVTNNPNQTFTTTTTGNYTLSMNPPGSCTPITRTVNVAFGASPTAGFTTANACTTFSFTNTGTGPPAVQTYSFMGAGPPPSFTTTATTTVVNFPPSTTFTVLQVVTNTAGCTSSVQSVINVPAGPNPAFTTPTPTQCLTGNSYVFTATQSTGTHTFAFNPTAGAPPTGNASPYGPVSFTAPGTYTVTHSITNAGCTTSASSVIVINPDPTVTANNNSPICLGGNVNLTSTGGGTYSWVGPNSFASAVQNPTITGITMAGAGTYTVTVNLSGCVGTATTLVSVGAATASASNTGPYCAGQNISLIGSAGTTFTWSGPGGYSSNSQSPNIANATTAMAGVYNYTVNLGGCIANGSTNVTVNALPVPTATNNGPLCEGSTLNLTGSAASSYTWNGPNSFTSNSQSPSITTVTSSATGTYTFVVTDVNNCTNSVTTNVVINPNPPLVVNNPSVCIGDPINLTASAGGSSYSWSGPSGFTSSVQNPVIPVSTAANAGAYSVTLTTAAGCSNTAVANVGVFPVPSPTITSNSPVCVGGQLNLNGSGGVTYQWTGPNNFNNPNQNPNISPVTAAAAGTYTLLASAGSCTAQTTAVVVINPLPNPNIVTNSPICTGFDLNLSATGGTSFAWAGPNSFMSTNQTETITAATVANAGTYTVVVTDTNGCVNFTTANVIVNAQPVVGATGTTVCQNSSAQLTANGGVTYSWSGPGGYTSNSQNPVLFNVGSASAGQYTVLVTDANSCTNTAVATIGVNPAPVPNANVNSPICMNDIMNLSATGGVTYNWTGPNGFISSTQSPTVLANSTSVSGIYQVTVIDANSCTASATINAVVNPLPVPQITSGPNVGCAPLCVDYSVQSIPTASLAYWTFGNGESANGVLNSTSCYNGPGIYTITATVTDVNGCLGQATYTAEVYPKPTADFNHAPIKPIINIDGDVVFTDASWGANIISWNWYFMNTAQYTSTLQNPTFLYTEPGNYVVALVVKSDKGCSDTLLRPLVVGEDYGLYVPNAFTPNADGFNDVFQAKGFGIVKYEMYIFDRWGEKVYHTKDFYEAWDGTYQGRGGKICKEDVYTWLIDCTDVFGKSHELKGHVTLIR